MGQHSYIFARSVWNITQIMHASDLIFYNKDLISQNNVMHLLKGRSTLQKRHYDINKGTITKKQPSDIMQ